MKVEQCLPLGDTIVITKLTGAEPPVIQNYLVRRS